MKQLQRFGGCTDAIALHEPAVIVYARGLNDLEIALASAEEDIITLDLIINEIPSTIYENILERLGMEIEDE